MIEKFKRQRNNDTVERNAFHAAYPDRQSHYTHSRLQMGFAAKSSQENKAWDKEVKGDPKRADEKLRKF